MALPKKLTLPLFLAVVVTLTDIASPQGTPANAATRPVGTVKSIAGNSMVLTTDAGTTVNVKVQNGARLLRVAPGEKDLKNASPLAISDIQAGDRVLLRGTLEPDGKTLLAASVIAVKREDVAQRRLKDLQDWNKGVGGLVKSTSPQSNAVVISVASIGSSKEFAITTTPNTKVRRYSEDSVKFDDAKPSELSAIKLGDQLRARGARNADNTGLTAEEVVFGSFRNLSGMITEIDPKKNTITIADLASKKIVTVHISSDSQMHKLPQMAATMIAMRLKGIPLPGGVPGGAGPGGQGHGNGAPNTTASGQGRGNGTAQGVRAGTQGGPGGAGSNGRAAGSGDLQQMLSRMPALQFSDFQKGDAVMIVATEGSASSDSTAINLISGVEPILTAAPNGAGAAASLLQPWNLGAVAGGDPGTPQ